MTDAELQEQINKRLAEHGLASSTDTSSVSEPEVRHAKPPAHIAGQDESQSSAAKTQTSDNSSSSFSNAMDAIDQAEKKSPDQTEKPFSKAQIIASNLASKAKALGEKDYQGIGAGALTGYVLPKIVEGVRPGSIASPENEFMYRQRLEQLRQEEARNPFKEYEAQSKNFMAQQQFAQQRFLESQRQLNDAIAHNEMLRASSVDDFLPPEFRTTPSAPESVLTRQPIGGEATSKYAEKFGLTPLESLEAPSMSKVQQKIPSVAESISRAQAVGPEFSKFGESPLLLGPEGQKTAMEQKREQTIREQQRLQAEAEAKHKLAQQKAQAQIALENAQRAHDMNMKALRDVNRSIESHVQPGVPPTVSPEEQRLRTETERYGGEGTAGRVLSFLGRKVAPRFSPIIAGAMAPEQGLAAKEAYEKGDMPRMLAHGVGALGSIGMATGIPFFSGLGMVANLPSLYYEGEDLMKPPPPEKP